MASMLRRGRVRGKLGFKAPHRSIRKVLNVGQLQFVARGLAPEAVEKAQGPIEIDLTKLGVRKLLGSGIVEGPFLVKVDSCSSSARRKIEEAGGKVLMPQPSTKG
jgi:large subunit ribosomal protein L15